MKRFALALAVAALVAAFAPSHGLSQNGPTPTGFAFLDVREAFRGLDQRQAIEDQFRQRTQSLDARFRGELASIEDLEDEIAELNEGSEPYRVKQREIDIKRLTIKRDREYEARKLQSDAKRQEAMMYRSILREARAVAESRGLAAVFLETELGSEFERSQDMDLVMATRAVLWSDPRLDITQEVVQRLNGR